MNREIIARDTLERYSGSKAEDFCSYLLLTNFPRYVDAFAAQRKLTTIQGSMFQVAHDPDADISILDFKVGSPGAALAIDVCSCLPIKASLMLGMCGGLRRHYEVGDYLVPIASIRGEGTSDFYFPEEVPALANFLVQKAATDILQEKKMHYHIGITHTSNIRFWEFDFAFRKRLRINRAQAYEMECATLFAAGYKYRLPVGALLLISDLPLTQEGIKTKDSSHRVYEKHTHEHIELGVAILEQVKKLIFKKVKGAYRGQMASAHFQMGGDDDLD